MKDLKHTPGNWKISNSGNPYFELCITTDKGGSICHLTQWPEHEANAQLIAAAPGMLNDIIKDIKVYSDISHDIKNLKADIAFHMESKIYDKNIIAGFKRCIEKIDLIEKATGLKIEEIIK